LLTDLPFHYIPYNFVLVDTHAYRTTVATLPPPPVTTVIRGPFTMHTFLPHSYTNCAGHTWPKPTTICPHFTFLPPPTAIPHCSYGRYFSRHHLTTNCCSDYRHTPAILRRPLRTLRCTVLLTHSTTYHVRSTDTLTCQYRNIPTFTWICSTYRSTTMTIPFWRYRACFLMPYVPPHFCSGVTTCYYDFRYHVSTTTI